MDRISKGQALLLTHKDTGIHPYQCEDWLRSIDKTHWKPCFEYGATHGGVYYVEIERGCLGLYHAEAARDNQRRNDIPLLLPAMLRVAKCYLPIPEGHSEPAPIISRNRAMYGDAREVWNDYGLVRASIPLDRPDRLRGQISDQGGRPHLDLEGLAPQPHTMFDHATEAYSMVLCLAKPKRGGNLRVWPGNRFTADEQLFANPDTHADDEARFAAMPHVDLYYHAGSVALFDSFCYHQILGSTFTKARPERIIAGVHFLYRADLGVWEYWF